MIEYINVMITIIVDAVSSGKKSIFRIIRVKVLYFGIEKTAF
jgi:hypothetical protein